LIYLFNNFQFGEMQLGELQFGEMPHFFNTPHAFKKNGETQPGEMQFGEMPHTRFFTVVTTVNNYYNKF